MPIMKFQVLDCGSNKSEAMEVKNTIEETGSQVNIALVPFTALFLFCFCCFTLLFWERGKPKKYPPYPFSGETKCESEQRQRWYRKYPRQQPGNRKCQRRWSFFCHAKDQILFQTIKKPSRRYAVAVNKSTCYGYVYCIKCDPLYLFGLYRLKRVARHKFREEDVRFYSFFQRIWYFQRGKTIAYAR